MQQKGNILPVILIVVMAIGIIGFIAFRNTTSTKKDEIILSPFSKIVQKVKTETSELTNQENYPLGKPIVGVLFGIDRRSRDEGFRTDIMILIAANPETNKVVMASIPRDLWYDGGRINALYPGSGWEAFQNAMEDLTGLKPSKYVLTDFKDFTWVVDAMGGVPVTVETTFTDSNYPVDETKGYQTVNFTKGYEKLTGDRALIYARSRKGDFDNGDWGRMKRQHNILKGMLTAVLQPSSIFNPMIVENAYKTVTQGKMDTNLSITDAKYLWDFYKDKDKYKIDSLYMDYDYLYNPPAEEYGGAWVMVPQENGKDLFKQKIKESLYNLQPNTETLPDEEITE